MTVHTTGTREEWLAVGERATAREALEESLECYGRKRNLPDAARGRARDPLWWG